MITAHSHYQIGSSHKFCEDFAIHGSNGNEGFIVVCDGCSSSGMVGGQRQSINVDFGSRLLACSVRQLLKETGLDFLSGYKSEIYEKIICVLSQKLKESLSIFDLNYNVLDSTLMFAGMNKHTGGAFCIGDGLIVLMNDNECRVVEIEYSEGAPFYISYLLDKNYLERYKNEYGEQKKIYKESIFNREKLRLEVVLEESFDLSHESFYFTYLHRKLYSDTMYNTIVLFSDGINTFGTSEQHKSGNQLSLVDPLAKFIDFPNKIGSFVSKRFNVVDRWSRQNNLVHTDDISMAAICHINDK